MKKILAVCMALIMVMSISFTAFATGAFVESPSNNNAPVLEDFSNESEECAADVIVTSYAERDTLPEDARKAMEEAYTIIASTEDLTELNNDLAELAKNKNIPGANLAVSDLFDARYTENISHEGHGKFTLQLSAETLHNFVGLMQYINNEWVLVKDATVNGNRLTFSAEELSTFAVVVETEPTTETGDNSNIILYVVIMAICALALIAIMIVLWRKSKKQAE